MRRSARTHLLRTWRRVVFRWRRAQLYRELAEELEFHRSLKQQENTEAGLSAEEAAEISRKQMGNVTLAKEESRDTWSFMRLERFWHDLRYAGRMFAKSPGFTTVAVLSLALGIGGNAAMFSLVNALLIRPLPFSDPDRLVRITGIYPRAALVVFQQQSRTMDVASVSPGSEFNLTGQGEAVRLVGSLISANLFSVLGTQLERGRAFEAGEDRPGRDNVVILSHSLWRTKFGSDPQIVGRMITIEGVNRQVVGVMRANFSFPSTRVQLWIPARLDPANMIEYWGGEFVPLIGRLRPGVRVEQARSEIRPFVARVRRMFPFPMARDWNANASAIPLKQDMTGDIRPKLLILLSAVGILLLIACANVAGLLLSRATVRRKEIALRAALGAGRGRIVRQLLTESVALALVGGGLGILLGTVALSIFRSVLPLDTPGLSEVRVDWQVTGFATVLAILTGLAFGMAPALNASQIDLTESIKTGSQRSTAATWAWLRSWLIAGEVALTVILVAGAGLLIKSLYALSQVNTGFQPAHILAIRISPNQSLCRKPAACVAFYDELIRRARDINGVSNVATANTIPVDGDLPTIPVDVEGHPKSADYPAPMLWAGAVSPDYLQMTHVPLLAGRGFAETDGANSGGVVLISATTAKHFWPGENAIGKHIKTTGEQGWRTVIGVVGDVRQYKLSKGLPSWVDGAMYMLYPQSVRYAPSEPSGQEIPVTMNLLVKTSGDSSRTANEIRELARNQDPNVAIGEVRMMEQIVSGSVSDVRSTMGVFVSFAATAMLLAAVGIYGLVSYWVAQRRYEIGVRVAIGATRSNIVALVLGQGLRITALGTGAGVIAAIVLTRFLTSLLYGVTPTDPLTFIGATVLLIVIALFATYVPAWRAARIDPVKSLRVE